MTKLERLAEMEKQIEALKTEIANERSYEITLSDAPYTKEVNLNGKWIASIHMENKEMDTQHINTEYGCRRLFLNDTHGTWRDERGEEIEGFLFFQPK